MSENRGWLLPANTNLRELPAITYDVAVIGSGIAGMAAALSLDPGYKVALVNKEPLTESSTYKAQGGMAVAIGPDDNVAEHIADTLRVGQGLCRREAVEIITQEGIAALSYLQTLGANFNGDEHGLALAREAGHSRSRVVHYYDYTGRHIAETMLQAVDRRTNITCLSGYSLVDLITEDDYCRGCVILKAGRLSVLRANIVVLATGGYSGVYGRSTNPAAGGDGIAAAYRAGAVIADLEFIQFHPTTFQTAAGQTFLLTEALRGEGALLRNAAGERFMPAYHPDGELAPRDEVSRAITREMARENRPFVYLDARRLGQNFLADRFPQVYAELSKNGLRPDQDLIPTAPAAHYTIGGVATDMAGRTSIRNLYACGEVAATGVHGANRLASNSLLESLVFGRRVARAVNQEFPVPAEPKYGSLPFGIWPGNCQIANLGRELDQAAGVVRTGEALNRLLKRLNQTEGNPAAAQPGVANYQAANACCLAQLILTAALLRQESRGTHFRADYPETVDRFSCHINQQWGKKVIWQ